jgi:hypothetical protein
MFVGKPGAYSSKDPFRCSNLGQAPVLTLKQFTGLDRPACDKQSSLLRTFKIYGRKKALKHWFQGVHS